MKFWHATLKPALKKPLRKLRQKLWARQLEGKDTKDIFTSIYRENKWGDSESVSGPGSTLNETAHLRPALEKIFAEHDIKTIIDVPCGDFNWFKEIGHEFELYRGYDIVEDLVKSNAEKYGNDNRTFKQKNCLEEPFEKADMVFCRDLLLHLSSADIFRLFQNLERSDIPLLLISHAVGIENEEIVTGQGRLVNLTAAPFNLPEPEEIIMENSAVFDGKYKDIRAMALWKTEDIFKALEQNPAYAKKAA